MNLVNIKQTTLETHTDQMTLHYLTLQQYRTTPWTDGSTSVHMTCRKLSGLQTLGHTHMHMYRHMCTHTHTSTSQQQEGMWWVPIDTCRVRG